MKMNLNTTLGTLYSIWLMSRYLEISLLLNVDYLMYS